MWTHAPQNTSMVFSPKLFFFFILFQLEFIPLQLQPSDDAFTISIHLPFTRTLRELSFKL